MPRPLFTETPRERLLWDRPNSRNIVCYRCAQFGKALAAYGPAIGGPVAILTTKPCACPGHEPA